MKRYSNIVLLCLILSSCMAQNRLNKSNLLLEKVYKNQLAYYNQRIGDKDNYTSILNFAKQGRNQIANKASNVIESGNFIIMEGFSPGWGKFVGLIWSDKVAYVYQRLPSKKLHVTKVNLKADDIKKATGIDPYILDKVKRWDINYISGLKGKIGTSVLDGYNFIATKVTYSEVEKDSKIETIAFEQFVDEKQLSKPVYPPKQINYKPGELINMNGIYMNNHEALNYMWGASMNNLEVGVSDALLGAQIFHMYDAATGGRSKGYGNQDNHDQAIVRGHSHNSGVDKKKNFENVVRKLLVLF